MATAMNINHEGFQRRLDAIQSILGNCGLQSTSVTPVEYVDYGPFPYNNFIYKIELLQPATPSTFPRRPGTVPAPDSGVSTLILRLSNPHAEGMNNANRIENDVAGQSLFRAQLSVSHPELAHLVPRVYAWEPCRYPEVPDEMGFAWTINEFMPGANLDAQFREMSLAEKTAVVEQVADIFAAFQKTSIPEQLRGHLGGLTFDGTGQVIGGQMPLLPPGPWQRYEELWVSRFHQQLHDADKSSALNGWKEGGLRDRIDKLITTDVIAKLLEGVDTTQRVLVHGDLTMNNMLFDKDTKRVTALLDYDWTCVIHPVHEFFTGLWDLGGGVNLDNEKLNAAVLSGKFGETDETISAEDKTEWEVAKAWDSALATRGVIRPSSIKGIEKLAKLKQLEDSLSPFHLASEVMVDRLKRKSPEKLEESIKAATEKLASLLEEIDA